MVKIDDSTATFRALGSVLIRTVMNPYIESESVATWDAPEWLQSALSAAQDEEISFDDPDLVEVNAVIVHHPLGFV